MFLDLIPESRDFDLETLMRSRGVSSHNIVKRNQFTYRAVLIKIVHYAHVGMIAIYHDGIVMTIRRCELIGAVPNFFGSARPKDIINIPAAFADTLDSGQ